MGIDLFVEELACGFGSDCFLTGVYTPAAQVQPGNPCVLYLTAGLLHHVGPTRLHVETARSFSQANVAGLRFDLSGVGDSETSSLGGYFLERSVSEIRQAMDYLQDTHGHESFVLFGLCSGADDALATAERDHRVAGIVLLNGYAYRAGYFRLFRFLKFYLPRLFMWKKLKNTSKRLLGRLSSTDYQARNTDQQLLDALDSDYRFIPTLEDTGNLLQRLDQQRTDMLFVYTGGEHDEYTYKGQFFAMFPHLRHSAHVTEHYAQLADHTFIIEADRIALITCLKSWYARSEFSRVVCDGSDAKDENYLREGAEQRVSTMLAGFDNE